MAEDQNLTRTIVKVLSREELLVRELEAAIRHIEFLRRLSLEFERRAGDAESKLRKVLNQREGETFWRERAEKAELALLNAEHQGEDWHPFQISN